MISLRAFNNVGDGVPIYETATTRRATSECKSYLSVISGAIYDLGAVTTRNVASSLLPW